MEEITGMNLIIRAVYTCTDTPECIPEEKIRHALQVDCHQSAQRVHAINGWTLTRAELIEEIHLYWPFQDDMTVIDDEVMKGRRIVIQVSLHQKALQQLHINHMDIQKMLMLILKMPFEFAQYVMNFRLHNKNINQYHLTNLASHGKL